MLIKDVTLGEFGYEGVMDFLLFNCKIGVHFDKDVTLEYAEKYAHTTLCFAKSCAKGGKSLWKPTTKQPVPVCV